MAERFRVGRVFIAGGKLLIMKTYIVVYVLTETCFHLDAAHAHSPAGGQGLNSSIADTVSNHPFRPLRLAN